MKIYQIDAFTKSPFKGNPAAVVILESIIDDKLMQNIAAEMNLSETAFIFKTGNRYSLRWFTPETEMPLCGHATLASAHLLYELGLEKSSKKIYFDTLSGELIVYKETNLIVMNFPVSEIGTEQLSIERIKESFKITPVSVYLNGNRYLIELENEQSLIDLNPDFSKLEKDYGYIVTAKSEKYDFVSRFFAPYVGIQEDPVTGSAHCMLVPYWAKKMGKIKFKAYQASKRGGELFCELIEGGRLLIKGSAVTLLEGNMNI